MRRLASLLLLGALAAPIGASADVLGELIDAHADRLGPAAADPERHRVQVLYTRIERDAAQHPRFETFGWRVDPEAYFYPASTVKLPVALLALEELARLGLDRDTPLFTMAAHPSQTPASLDATAPGSLATVGHYVRKIFLVSDNDAYNRLYEFLGQDAIDARLAALGFQGVRIVHRLSLPLSFDDNRRANPVRFVEEGRVLHERPERVTEVDRRAPAPIPLGVAEIVDGERIDGPKDFATKNALPLPALHELIRRVVCAELVPEEQRFELREVDLAFVRRAMATTPPESGIAAYADPRAYPAGYVKFLLYGGDAPEIPARIRSFNKVGDAYGFLTDSAYVVDFEAGVEFLLSATVYANANGTFNDDAYEYDTVGFPFLRALGEFVLEHERARHRQHAPDLSALAELVGYEGPLASSP